MSECNETCETCNTKCSNRCPVCHSNAQIVSKETVKNILITDQELVDDGDIYICLNRNCEVTYFNNSQYYVKDELKVPVWFKEKPNEMIVCYCHNITFKMIINAVKLGYNTKQEIINYYKSKNNEDCLHLNPIGKRCNTLFENTITYAKGEQK